MQCSYQNKYLKQRFIKHDKLFCLAECSRDAECLSLTYTSDPTISDTTTYNCFIYNTIFKTVPVFYSEYGEIFTKLCKLCFYIDH